MGAVSITVFDSETGTSTDYTFASSPVRIGRNALNDLSLPFGFVSGWHAVVRFDDEAAKFFDLGSTNGTLVGGRRVQAGEPVLVGAGVSLTIGKLELRLRHVVTTKVPLGQPGATERPVVGATDTTGRRESTAQVEMSDVHQTVHRLRPAYDAYRHAWSVLRDDLTQSVAAMPPGTRGFALSIFAREFPAVTEEAEFSGAMQAAAQPASRTSRGEADVSAVRSMALSLRPDEEPPRTGHDVARFLSCVEDILRASAKAFVELQRGQEQFGHEMGVRTLKEFTALHAAGTPDSVLRYLLDWQSGGPHRTQELVGAYADLMIHQVALLNGVMEGVRALLARLAPAEIERGVTAAWPTRTAAVWKAYVERYRRLAGDDKTVTEIVFGPEFARAYAEVGGEGG